MTDTDIMLYIHIPFCVRKCSYCDFLSQPAGKDIQENYVDVLCRQMEETKDKAVGLPVSSIFFGGGTPSLLTGMQIGKILEVIRANYTLTEDCEISMEMNPGTVNPADLELYKKAGINRVSLGLQSMQPEELKMLGRIHTAQKFLESYEMVKKAGFTNVNVDLMMGLPGQSWEALGDTIEKIVAIAPEHISLYSLILEEGTKLYKEYADSDTLLTEEEDRALYHKACELLQKAGYEQYEISNFARPGFSCRHNEGYWRRRPYLSFGIGAASFFEEQRWNNTSVLKDYLRGDFTPQDHEALTEQDAMEEFMFLGLRTLKGICEDEFTRCFEEDFREVYGEAVDRLLAEGLVQERERSGSCWLSCTKEGLDLNNYVCGAFLLD